MFRVALLVAVLAGLSSASQYIITPAYFYPSGSLLEDWAAVESAAPTSKVLVANVDSGPGDTIDSTYNATLLTARQKVEVIGYVHTLYGSSLLSVVMQNVSLWNSLYGVTSFFLDETASSGTHLGYYTNLTGEIRQAFPNAKLVANLGTMPEVEGYMALFDVLCVFEDTYANYVSTFTTPSWYTQYPASKYYHIVQTSANVTEFYTAAALSQERNAEYVYITDHGSYNKLPSYWQQEVSYFSSSASRLTAWPIGALLSGASFF